MEKNEEKRFKLQKEMERDGKMQKKNRQTQHKSQKTNAPNA